MNIFEDVLVLVEAVVLVHEEGQDAHAIHVSSDAFGILNVP